MDKFDPSLLKTARLRQQVSAAEIAKRMNVSTAQITRWENGQRRLTVDTLLAYCQALDTNVSQFFVPNIWVPVVGVLDSDSQVLPLPPNHPEKILLPPMSGNTERLGAIPWVPGMRLAHMRGHVHVFHRHDEGIPEKAWNNRCLIARADGSQCIGWPIRKANSTHIDNPNATVEFNVDIVWASPVIAVVAPWVMEDLEPPDR